MGIHTQENEERVGTSTLSLIIAFGLGGCNNKTASESYEEKAQIEVNSQTEKNVELCLDFWEVLWYNSRSQLQIV